MAKVTLMLKSGKDMQNNLNCLKKWVILILISSLMALAFFISAFSAPPESTKTNLTQTTATVQILDQDGAKPLPTRTGTTGTIAPTATTAPTQTTLPHFKIPDDRRR